MSLQTYFQEVESNDPDVLTSTVMTNLLAGTIHIDAVRTAVYMEASAYVNRLRGEAQSAHFTARKARKAAESSGNPERIASAVHDELLARQAYLQERIHLGDGKYVLIGEATIEDFDAAIAWVEKHELVPARRKVEQYRTYQEDIRKAGVLTLRDMP